jgi:hypothetical protein
MRDMVAILGGHEITLRATFAAAAEIAQRVADPIAFAREASMAMAMPGYVPKVTFNVQNLPVILWIGMKAAGSKATMEQVQSDVFEAGFPEAMGVADAYLAMIVSPKSERKIEADGDAEPGE